MTIEVRITGETPEEIEAAVNRLFPSTDQATPVPAATPAPTAVEAPPEPAPAPDAPETPAEASDQSPAVQPSWTPPSP